MVWTVKLDVKDVNGKPIANAQMKHRSWTGIGKVIADGPNPLTTAKPSFTVPDDVISLTIELRHPQYANLVLALMRNANEKAWRWTHPNRTVVTTGSAVAIDATMGRIAPAPTHEVSDSVYKKMIDDAQAREFGKPPPKKNQQQRTAGIDAAKLRGVRVNEKQLSKKLILAKESSFHVAKPDLLGDRTAPNWRRFASDVVEVDTRPLADFYLVEYGDVGASTAGPRFLCGLWVPKAAVTREREDLDVVLWYHPNTDPPTYPADKTPFRGGDYPYVLWASRNERGIGLQPFVQLPISHLSSTQHWLSFALAAAGRSAVIAIPSVPMSHFAPFASQTNLIRFLKEVCLWLPRVPDDSIPRAQPGRLQLRRLAVAGFSHSPNHITTLVGRRGPSDGYFAPTWIAPAAELDPVWSEVWSIDCHFETRAHMTTFLETFVGWTDERAGRRFRFYNNNVTNKPWDPRKDAKGKFAKAIAKAKVIEQGRFGDPLWAVQLVTPDDKLRVGAFSEKYLIGTEDSLDRPKLDDVKAHESMPMVMFGHAARTSDLKRSSSS